MNTRDRAVVSLARERKAFLLMIAIRELGIDLEGSVVDDIIRNRQIREDATRMVNGYLRDEREHGTAQEDLPARINPPSEATWLLVGNKLRTAAWFRRLVQPQGDRS